MIMSSCVFISILACKLFPFFLEGYNKNKTNGRGKSKMSPVENQLALFQLNKKYKAY